MLSIQSLWQKSYGALLLLLLLLGLHLSLSPSAQAVIPGESLQLVVVTTDSWESTEGHLQTFSRTEDGLWQADSVQSSVILGRAGLAWGIGLHPQVCFA